MPRKKQPQAEADLDRIVEQLPAEELREVVIWAAQWHEDVERRVRLIAARSSGDLRELRVEVDRGLRTRRFLGYRESVEWARAARRLSPSSTWRCAPPRPRTWWSSSSEASRMW